MQTQMFCTLKYGFRFMVKKKVEMIDTTTSCSHKVVCIHISLCNVHYLLLDLD